MCKSKAFFSIFLFSVFNYCLYAQEYYRQHVIVLADQTLGDGNVGFDSLKNATNDIIALFSHNDSTIYTDRASWHKADSLLHFSETTDQLTVYPFVLFGKDHSSIKYRVRSINPSDIYSIVSNLLVHRGFSFDGSIDSLSCYMKYILAEKDNEWRTEMRKSNNENNITLSHYVYPCIIENIHATVPAERYMIIVLTDYKSGADFNDSDDMKRLEELFGTRRDDNPYVKAFTNRLTQEEGKYPKVPPYFNLKWHGKGDKIIYAKAFQVEPNDICGSQVAVTSNLSFQQERYDSDSFRIGKCDISWPSDPNYFSRIQMNIMTGRDTLYSGDIKSGKINYEHVRRCFSIDSCTISIENGRKLLNADATLSFQYVLYGDTTKSQLPMVFVASHNLNPSMCMPPDKELWDYIWEYRYLLLGCIILLIALFFRHLYTSRGRKNTGLSCAFERLSVFSEKYQSVDDMKVTELDCWYRNNNADEECLIPVSITTKCDYPFFAKHYGIRIYYTVKREDHFEQFGMSIDDGNDRDLGFTEYYAELKKDEKFKFNVRTFAKNGYELDYDSNKYILRFRVSARLALCDEQNNEIQNTSTKSIEYEYTFIVKKNYDGRSRWFAFDPGTSSSCIAFGAGGTPVSNDNIHFAKVKVTRTGNDSTPQYDNTIASKIVVPDNSGLYTGKTIDNAKPTVDFYYGVQAEHNWMNSRTKYESIKKLLGYSNIFPTQQRREPSNHIYISGEDAAFLLVKGLFSGADEYIKSLKDPQDSEDPEDSEIIKLFPESSILGRGDIGRAIVAVPNSYTLVKIQSMVNTIKRLKSFSEVHYIYESEAVLMNYLHKEWHNLTMKGTTTTTVIVFDMGGATINLSAFDINVHTNERGIDKININTKVRTGYYVGGDDIDFAIMKLIYGMPSMAGQFSDENDIKRHQRGFKSEILDTVREIKIWHIDRVTAERENRECSPDNRLTDINTFLNYLNAKRFVKDLKVKLSNDIDGDYLENNTKGTFERLIYSEVRDAAQELVRSLRNENRNEGEGIQIIFSGKSILFPDITRNAMDEFKELGECEEWYGFRDGEYVDNVKTAVARGACWYAMFSNIIEISRNIVTSTFGFLDVKDGKDDFHEVILRGTLIDDSCLVSEDVVPWFNRMTNIKFIQLFSSEYKAEQKHKYNIISNVFQNIGPGFISNVRLDVDNTDYVNYHISTTAANTIREGKALSYADDVFSENRETYTFTTPSEDDDVLYDRTNTIKESDYMRF